MLCLLQLDWGVHVELLYSCLSYSFLFIYLFIFKFGGDVFGALHKHKFGLTTPPPVLVFHSFS